MDLPIEVAPSASKAVSAKQRLPGEHLLAIQHLPREAAGKPGEPVIQEETRGELHPARRRASVDRNEERKGRDKVRGKLPLDCAFAKGLLHQFEFEALEIPKAAMDELARSARRVFSQVSLFDQGDREPVQGCFSGNTGSKDARSHDEQVESTVGKREKAVHGGAFYGQKRGSRPSKSLPWTILASRYRDVSMSQSRLTKTIKVLADPVRLRILHLLRQKEITVSELLAVLNLGQSRVSGHLAKLAEESLVTTRREGRFVVYSTPTEFPEDAATVVAAAIAKFSESKEAAHDLKALKDALRSRDAGMPPDSLGSDYLPGRTWEGLAKALLAILPKRRIADLGIGRGDLTLLLAESAEHLIAVDLDPQALTRAKARAREKGIASRMDFRLGDLNDPPIEHGEVDLWILSQVLHLCTDPERALHAAFARLSRGGQIVILDLLAHSESWVLARLQHSRLGFRESTLKRMLVTAGFAEVDVRRVARDQKPPHFVSILATGRKTR